MLILPRLYADRIAESPKDSGVLHLRFDEGEQLAVVDGFRHGQDGNHVTGLSDVLKNHFLAHGDTAPNSGVWFRVDSDLHVAGLQARWQAGALKLDFFRSQIQNGAWISPGAGCLAITVTQVPSEDRWHYAGWVLTPDSASFCLIEIEDEHPDLLSPLAESWPLDELADAHVAVLGVGSIGSAACESLTAYGIRRLSLVDPDRLLRHNFARHRAHPDQLGRHKVNAVAALLRHRDPALDVTRYATDIVWDADRVRPVLADADIALVCVDGVQARRAANHLAARAGLPAVYACVLADGAYGEIVRSDPPRTGCLECLRAKMRAEGAIDPEPALDRGYGTGTPHLPMTAVAGDLGAVAALAAKATVATLLERQGHRDQRLPGDHAILSLRPKPDIRPPLDLESAGDIRWHESIRSRPECLSCGSPP